MTPSRLRRARIPLAVLAGVSGWVFLGGIGGIALGALLGCYAWRALSQARSPDELRREKQLRADAPLVADLLGRVLAAGADIGTALLIVGEAVGGPWEERLESCINALRMGQSPPQVWGQLDDPGTQALGRALLRSARFGVPVADAMRRLALDLREQADLAAHAHARTIEVRATAPLGVCFLPAFVLLGVVPLVAGILQDVTWIGR